ncbi:MAG: U32 family peptidase [Planctomycetaceae bacterium]|nr:U32 family peptidase [Planctomycetaceae bacterium]
MPSAQPKIELLSPAGDLTCARAAVENGADAVYFGLDHGFNARARATNFSSDALDQMIDLLHGRSVLGYVTLNTLVFPRELERFSQLVQMVASAGVDAVLVQDLGIARLIRELCPELPIHASTQMTLTSGECIDAIASLGIDRVVLPRESSIQEIREISKSTSMPLEAFVHGALCVAYSGQCLTSESLGGRSANRGQCAQACRLPYELMCDGKDVDLGEVRYLLSPQDLAAFELVPDLIEAGVSSFKIEGRLKTPEYVANVTQRYRTAIDLALKQQAVRFSRRDVEEMELSFSRGFSPGWLQGCDHKMLVPGLSSTKRGVILGMVRGIRRDRVEIELQSGLSPGDGVVFEGDRAAGQEQGGRVFHVWKRRHVCQRAERGDRVEIAFGRQAVDIKRLYVGQKIWKTDDPKLTRQLQTTFTGRPRRKVDLDLVVQAKTGEKLFLSATTSAGQIVQCESDAELVRAHKHPATEATLKKQIDRLGNTVYQLRSFCAEIDGEPMVPLSALGKLRHEMVAQLDETLKERPKRTILSPVRSSVGPSLPKDELVSRNAQLSFLCRSLPQLEELLRCNIDRVIVDFADIREYTDAVRLTREQSVQILLATPRIHKPSETGLFRKILRQEAHGVLVRNLAGLAFFVKAKLPAFADFSLNVANQLTAEVVQQAGAERMTVSYDLSRDQVFDLIDAVPASWLEVVIHQHMPMFHMEHCVFCAVLSPGTNKTNCGRPCDDHEVHLRDRVGMEHLLTADVGCRNTLFNAQAQSSAEIVPDLLQRGLRNFRVELLGNESFNELERIVELYQQLVAGQVSAKHVWRDLKACNRVGVTRGTLEERRDPLAIL